MTEKEREAFGEAGEADFVDVSSALSGRGMPKIRIDGPFGQSEGGGGSSEASHVTAADSGR